MYLGAEYWASRRVNTSTVQTPPTDWHSIDTLDWEYNSIAGTIKETRVICVHYRWCWGCGNLQGKS